MKSPTDPLQGARSALADRLSFALPPGNLNSSRSHPPEMCFIRLPSHLQQVQSSKCNVGPRSNTQLDVLVRDKLGPRNHQLYICTSSKVLPFKLFNMVEKLYQNPTDGKTAVDPHISPLESLEIRDRLGSSCCGPVLFTLQELQQKRTKATGPSLKGEPQSISELRKTMSGPRVH